MSIVLDLKQKIINTIVPLTGSGVSPKIYILDVPNYPNVGDPAILVGELAFLRECYPESRISMVSNGSYDEDVAREVDRADIIFLHGGGSFGDIWPIHHTFRLRILKRFAHRQIIQFPQSIHFENPIVLESTKRLIEAAKQYIVIARDEKSRQFSEGNFSCRTVMAPDMAFCMGPLVAPTAAVDLICLLRTDKERLDGPSQAALKAIQDSSVSFEVFDWLKNRNNIERIHQILDRAVKFGLPKRLVAKHGAWIYERYAMSRLSFGIEQLGRGRTVLTDRLHGHIISTLMGKHQIVMDSMDGKVKMFNQTWLKNYAKAKFVSDPQDIADILSNSEAVGV